MKNFRTIAFVIFAGSFTLTFLPLTAQSLTLQMLGPSEIVGTAAVIDVREGTNIDFAGLGVDGNDFVCFEMPLVEAATDIILGSGVDCLRFDPPGLIFGGNPALADGVTVTEGTMTVTVFSFFVLPGGTLVNFGTTTIQPFVAGFGDGFIAGDSGNPQVTHLTGSIPNGASSIAAGTRRFSRVSGHGRVSGAVSVLPIDVAAGIGPSFDCLWELTLDPPEGRQAGRGRP